MVRKGRLRRHAGSCFSRSEIVTLPLGHVVDARKTADVRTSPVCGAGSNGRCNTIWYKAVFKGGVYETRKTVWTFSGAEVRRVATLEGGADAA